MPGFLSSRPKWTTHPPHTLTIVVPPPPFGSWRGHTRLRGRRLRNLYDLFTYFMQVLLKATVLCIEEAEESLWIVWFMQVPLSHHEDWGVSMTCLFFMQVPLKATIFCIEDWGGCGVFMTCLIFAGPPESHCPVNWGGCGVSMTCLFYAGPPESHCPVN